VPADTALRLPLAEAQALADEVVSLLAPACERLVVAGSIRRRRPDVGDIELVAVPALAYEIERVDLFTRREVTRDRLETRCADLLAGGVLAHRYDRNGRPAWGPKYKRLLYRGFALDLFAVPPPAENFGVILALRTGPVEWNQQLVLKRSQGGWLPRGLFFKDGWLWKLPPPYTADLALQATRVPTPDEASLFRVLGYACVPPEKRSGDRPPPARSA